MISLDEELQRRLAAIRNQGLHRELRRVDSPQGPGIEMAGRRLINFSSNDYLGLANHPALKDAAIRGVERCGAGSGASRLICGSLAPHHELEEALAAFKGVEAALTFSSGYAAALGTITALVGKEDVLVVDKLIHACVVDAAKLSGAKLRIFAHNDLENLEDILKSTNQNPRTADDKPHTLIVTESVFSMDGDRAPLREMVALKQKHGAWLMVDEAHATGLYGPNRRGLAEELGLGDRIEVHMGTLGKALGASGGYICGSRTLIDYLTNRARSFIFSTAPVPAAVAAATAGIQLTRSDEGEQRRRTLWQRVSECTRAIPSASICPTEKSAEARDAAPVPGAIRPFLIGDETVAVAIATQLREQGIFLPAIRYPTVARGSARLRITLTAAHSRDDIARLSAALAKIVNPKS